MQSGCIASRFNAVSTSVSPFVTLEEETEMLTASAERRFAANSKEVRVRVEFSKNRLMMVFPRRVGTFFISREFISRKFSAVFKIPTISSAERLRIPSKSRRRNGLSIMVKRSLVFGLRSLIKIKDQRPKAEDQNRTKN